MIIRLLLLSTIYSQCCSANNKVLDFNYNSINGTTWLNQGTESSIDIDLNGYAIYKKNDSKGSFKSVCFDANSQCLSVQYDISPSNHLSLSIELYAYQLSVANNYGWVVSNDNGGYDRSIIMHDDRYGGGVAQGVGHTYNSGHSALASNEWNHIIAVWNYSKNEATLYVNNDTAITTSTANNDGYSYFCLNTNPNEDGHEWNGCFAKVVVYDYALSSTEIGNLKNKYTEELAKSGDDDENSDDSSSSSDSDDSQSSSDSSDAAAAIGSRLNDDNNDNNSNTNSEYTEEIVISFSKNTMINIWALVIGFLGVNVVIAWCYCFRSKKRTKITFEDEISSKI